MGLQRSDTENETSCVHTKTGNRGWRGEQLDERSVFDENDRVYNIWTRVFAVRLVQELVELVLADLQMRRAADGQQTCLEVGCGSGAVSLSLMKSLPQVRVLFSVYSGLFSCSG